MKAPVLSSIVLLLGCVSPLFGIERPGSLDAKPHEKKGERVEGEQLPGTQLAAAELPWLGVIGNAPDETLRQHLALEGGVVLHYVAEESPAADAGLRAHDIVLDVAGEKVSSQADLREAVARFSPGEKVTLTIVTKGQHVQKEVVLGQRPPALARPVPEQHFGQFNLDKLPDLRELRGLDRILPRDLVDGDAQVQIEEMLKDMEEKLKNLEKLPGVDLDIEEMLKELPRVGIKAASQITLMDDEGSVEMKFRDGGKEVVVRDLEGEVVYEGPWDNEQDRAIVPADIRERIEKLNFDIGNKCEGLQLQFGDPEPDAEAGERVE